MNWELVTLGELGEFRNGLNYTKENEGNGLKVIAVKDFGGLRTPEIERLGEINPNGVITDESLLQKNDIVFVRSNGNKDLIGRSMFIEDAPPNLSFSGFCIRMRPANKRAVPKFLAYFFRSPLFRKRLSNLGGGANIQNLNQKVMKSMEISLPGTPEQEEIVRLVSAYDDLIENNRRRIALLDDAARQLYKEWFVRFRFPGHEHVKMTDGVPEGWEAQKLGSLLAKVKRPGKVKKDDYLDEGPIPCVDQSQSFIGGYTDNEDAKITSPLPLVVFGDHTRVLKFIDFPFVCGADGTQLLFPNDDRLSIQYFYFAIDAIDLSNYFYARHFKFLKDQIVFIPTEKLVLEFTEFAERNLKQISTLRETNHRLAQARDLLLPKLMSGEIAV